MISIILRIISHAFITSTILYSIYFVQPTFIKTKFINKAAKEMIFISDCFTYQNLNRVLLWSFIHPPQNVRKQ